MVEQEAGIDLGIARLATVATTAGCRVDVANPKHLARKLRKLRRVEREKARRTKGGSNRAKTSIRRKVSGIPSITVPAGRPVGSWPRALAVIVTAEKKNQATSQVELAS